MPTEPSGANTESGPAELEQVFGGTDVGRDSTENRHSFVVLRFDFSEVRDVPETLEREFDYYCGTVIRRSLAQRRRLGTAVRHPASRPSPWTT